MSRKRRVKRQRQEAYKKMLEEENERQQKMDEEPNPFIFKLCLICIPLVIGGSFIVTSKGHSWLFIVISLLMFALWTIFGMFLGKYFEKQVKKENQAKEESEKSESQSEIEDKTKRSEDDEN